MLSYLAWGLRIYEEHPYYSDDPMWRLLVVIYIYIGLIHHDVYVGINLP